MKIGKRHVMLAGLVLALGAAVGLNWKLAPTERFVWPTGQTTVSDSELGKAKYVSADVSSDAKETGTTAVSPLSESRFNRQNARDAVLDQLEKQLKDASSDPVLKAQALESRTAHINNIQKENTTETLIKAKGYSDCMVFINDGKVTVLLPESDGLTADKVSVVTEIVTSQTGVQVKDITITPVK
ncbi:MAG: SpoIIIAH-like family protein [Clostridia bacterium]|nr:SpoIIIAH-like family protein [Clostridia bacterium]